MVVRQTFSSLSIRLVTEESSSELVGTEIVCSADVLSSVSGEYRNEPRFQARGRIEIHYGAVWLKIIDEPEKKVTGHYRTDRETAGEMELGTGRKRDFRSFSRQSLTTPTLRKMRRVHEGATTAEDGDRQSPQRLPAGRRQETCGEICLYLQ
jgi:hypothetical protein